MRIIIFSIFAFLILGAVSYAQSPGNSPNGTGVSDIYLAKDDGSGSPGRAATDFRPSDIPIYCVVQLDSFVPATVKMNLVAVNVPGVKPETRVVTSVYKTKDRQDRVDFIGRPDGLWVSGKYRVDVFVDGRPAGSREFTVSKTLQQCKVAESATTKPATFTEPIRKVRRPSN